MDQKDIISPFWRSRVTRIAEGSPSHLKLFFDIKLEVYSREGLREFLRFFMDNMIETEQSSPIELEIIRVTHEDSVMSSKRRVVTDRAVYHVDFRLAGQRDLIGHDHLHTEIIGVWISIGGQFVHRVTDYDDQGRPIRFKNRIHRSIPEAYID